MEMLDEMRKLLHEKKACFLQYEEETSRIASQEYREAEEFEAGIAARQRLIEEIDGIDERLKAMKNFSAEGERLFEISKNRWDFRTLNEEEQALFSEGQEIFRVISRIQELEPDARAEMERVRDLLQEKIRKNNTNTKFTGYLKQMDQGAKGMLYNQKR